MTSPLAGKPLRYLIGKDSDPGVDGCVTVIGYDAQEMPAHGIGAGYINPRDEHNTGRFGPYLPADDISAQYDEPAPIFDTDGFWSNFRPQISKWASKGARFDEVDNLDTYSVNSALKMFNEVQAKGLAVLVKNAAIVDGDQKQLLIHPAAAMVIVEKDCGLPASYDSMRRAAGKPDLPVRFVAFGDGRAWAQQVAQQIKAAGYLDMGVTYSASGEYGSSEDILLPKITSQPQPDPSPSPMPTQVTGADIIAFAASCIGKFTDGADVPKLANAIAARFPDDKVLAAYCRQASNSMPWCGDFVGYVMAVGFGIKPPIGASADDIGFFYVDKWRDFGTPIPVGQEQPGDVIGFVYPTLHHVTLCAGNGYYIGGNQSDAVTKTRFGATPSFVRRAPSVGTQPAPLPDDPGALAELSIGSIGPAVTKAQRLLIAAGFDVGPDGADGDFGEGTASAVSAFQSARSLADVDGVIGVDTWAALLKSPDPQPSPILSQDTINKIVALARSSSIAGYSWQGRGRAPIGYTNGMAVTFAKVYLDLRAGKSNALAMTKPLGSASVDALALYGKSPTLINLFALLLGLGMRESSGNCYEGRDTSASNVSADTAEAGLFQQSWNSHTASAEIEKALTTYSGPAALSGFLSIFREGLSGSPSENWGAGPGAQFQQICKNRPAFSVEAAAIGLRVIRSHWGPIIRQEAEFRSEAVALFQQVQGIVDAAVVVDPPPPPPPPPPDTDLEVAWKKLVAQLRPILLPILEKSMAPQAPQPPAGLPFSIPDIPDGAIRWAWPFIQRLSAEQIIGLKHKVSSGQFGLWDLLQIVMGGGSSANLLAPPMIDVSPSPAPPPPPAASPPVASGGLAEVLARPTVKIGAGAAAGTFMASLFGLLQDPMVIQLLYGLAATLAGGGVTGTFKAAGDVAKAQLGK